MSYSANMEHILQREQSLLERIWCITKDNELYDTFLLYKDVQSILKVRKADNEEFDWDFRKMSSKELEYFVE